MTDSGPRPGKRERLVASAMELVHHQGLERTTLAQIAAAADVPPGNVYYYFKTRDELVHAAIEAQACQVDALFEELEQLPEPRARLKGLIHSWSDHSDMVRDYGCPMGTLCSELSKNESELSRHAARLFARIVEWAAVQFGLMGHSDGPELAVTLLARIQGAMLLTNTLRDPRILASQAGDLENWIDSLA